MVLWAIKPSKFDIQYYPRITIKAQALANFIAEFTTSETNNWGATPWKVQIDRSSNKRVGGIGVVLQSPEGDIIECAIRLQFLTINNDAKYEAILMGLNLAKATKASSVVLHCDSQVVIGHINGDYEAKGKQMKKYLDLIRRRTSQTFEVKFL